MHNSVLLFSQIKMDFNEPVCLESYLCVGRTVPTHVTNEYWLMNIVSAPINCFMSRLQSRHHYALQNFAVRRLVARFMSIIILIFLTFDGYIFRSFPQVQKFDMCLSVCAAVVAFDYHTQLYLCPIDTTHTHTHSTIFNICMFRYEMQNKAFTTRCSVLAASRCFPTKYIFSRLFCGSVV